MAKECNPYNSPYQKEAQRLLAGVETAWTLESEEPICSWSNSAVPHSFSLATCYPRFPCYWDGHVMLFGQWDVRSLLGHLGKHFALFHERQKHSLSCFFLYSFFSV